MASLGAIRTAIRETVTAHLPGLVVYRTVPDVTQVPALVVQPRLSNFDVSMRRGTDKWEFDLFVLVARTETGLAQDSLDEYVTGAGPKSVRQVIFHNAGLGLSDGTDAHISEMTGPGQYFPYGGSFESARVPHIGACLRLIVHTPGTE